MKIFDLKLGYSCNNNCIHCVIADKKDGLHRRGRSYDLDTHEVMEIIENACQQGIQKIILTGGEISIRKDIALILQRIKKYQLSIGVQTNGRRIGDPMIMDVIRDYSDISFTVAIHGPNAKLHDHITREQGSYDETIEGIKCLLEAGKPVCCKIVISKFNYLYLKDTLIQLHSLGVRKVNAAFPHGMGNAHKYFMEVIPSYSQIKNGVIEMIHYARSHDIKLELEAFPLCALGKEGNYIEHIAELHELKNDETLYLQVRENQKNWDNDRLSIKSKFKQCRSCIYDEICEGTWNEYPVIYGEQEFQPIEFDKENVENTIAYIAQLTNS